MGSKPKKSDYQPSEADRTNAAISLQRYNDFKTKYQPMLVEMRDKAQRTGLVKIAKGRANADTMQVLQNQTPAARAATTVDETTGDTGRALASQLEKATAQGTNARNEMGAGVLAAANEQALTAQNGLAAVARINTSDTLSNAARRQSERDSKLSALTQLGTAFGGQVLQNIDGGGRWDTPNTNTTANADGSINPLAKGQKVSLKDRLGGAWDRLGAYGRVG
jgi:hypothetical protein